MNASSMLMATGTVPAPCLVPTRWINWARPVHHSGHSLLGDDVEVPRRVKKRRMKTTPGKVCAATWKTASCQRTRWRFTWPRWWPGRSAVSAGVRNHHRQRAGVPGRHPIAMPAPVWRPTGMLETKKWVELRSRRPPPSPPRTRPSWKSDHPLARPRGSSPDARRPDRPRCLYDAPPASWSVSSTPAWPRPASASERSPGVRIHRPATNDDTCSIIIQAIIMAD